MGPGVLWGALLSITAAGIPIPKLVNSWGLGVGEQQAGLSELGGAQIGSGLRIARYSGKTPSKQQNLSKAKCYPGRCSTT